MSSNYTLHSSSHPAKPSALAQAPKLDPPAARSRTSSPIRKPLHDRSNSQTNSYSGPTIRIVDDPGSPVYSKFPTPSEPSHILPPPRHAPGYGFERPGSRVSSGSQVANTIAKYEASRNSVAPSSLPRRTKAFRHSVSTSFSDTSTLVASSFTPSSVRFSRASTPPSSPPADISEFEKNLESLREEPPLASQKPTIRAVPPSSSGSGGSLEDRAAALTSEVSGTSSASPEAAISKSRHSDSRNSAGLEESISQSSKPSAAADFETETEQTPYSQLARARLLVQKKPSTDSFAFSDISTTSIEPVHNPIITPPPPVLHDARTAKYTSGPRISYPIVRPPSASGLRAESQNSLTVLPRMQERSLNHQWSSQLSTIPSMSERDSRSIPRASRSIRRSRSHDSVQGNERPSFSRRRGHTVGSEHSSSDNVSEGQTALSAMPLPLFSPEGPSFDEKDYHSEHLDTISPLPIHVPLRMKSSGYLRRHNSDASSIVESRPGTAQSDVSTFIYNTIPAWARVYYQRGERISMGAPGSESSESLRLGTSHSGRTNTPSDGHLPLSVYRPRNRPRNRASQVDTISLTEDMQSMDGDMYALGPQMYQLTGYSTPHLRTDRRGQTGYSVWNAPSLDNDLNSTIFGRQNRQILLFCLGFLCPLSWIIASFLPIPASANLAPARAQTDLEQQFARDFGIADDKAFQKATWWRNLNRVMSGIGTLLIGVIIALAILASRVA